MPNYTYRFNVIENVTSVSRKIQDSFDRMNKSANGFANQLIKIPAIGKLKGAMSGLGGAIAGAFAVDRVMGFGRSVIDTLSEFERYEAVLTNTFGDASAAKTILKDITDFAAKTPFQVNELTDAFVKLANRGFVPNMDQMTLLGDLAASQGKSFDQLAEAILDAETAEFERLKEFGIRASKEGNRVTLAFKGIQKQVENSPEAIRAALLELAKEAPGVTGSMAAISKTTGGLISNLIDAWTRFKLSVGQAFEPLLKAFLPKAIEFVQQLSGWVIKNQEAIRRWVPIILIVGGALAGLVTIGLGLSVISTAFASIAAVLAALFTPITGVILLIGGIGIALYKILDYAFPGFRDGVMKLWEWLKSLLGNAIKWVYEKFVQPIGKFLSGLFNGGKNKNGSWGLPEAPAAPSGDDTLYERLQSMNAGMGGSKPGGGGRSRGSSAAAGTITGDGGAGKNVIINITKLVETINLQVSNIQDFKNRVKEEVTRALIDAVNDVNYAN